MDSHLVSRGQDRNYTGFLTKTIVYSASLVAFLGAAALTDGYGAAFGLTIASIVIPKWVVFQKDRHYFSYGLHRRCSSLTDSCESFPQSDDCHGADRYFCSMWRSIGFLMSFAVVLEGMAAVSYLVILTGGKRLRESGWKALSVLVLLGVIVQAGAGCIVAYLYDHEDRFFAGWQLGESWTYCTISWGVSLLCAGVMVLGAQTLPSEAGYELIPDQA